MIVIWYCKKKYCDNRFFRTRNTIKEIYNQKYNLIGFITVAFIGFKPLCAIIMYTISLSKMAGFIAHFFQFL